MPHITVTVYIILYLFIDLWFPCGNKYPRTVAYELLSRSRKEKI